MNFPYYDAFYHGEFPAKSRHSEPKETGWIGRNRKLLNAKGSEHVRQLCVTRGALGSRPPKESPTLRP